MYKAPHPVFKHIGEKVRFARINRNLTQKQLAILCDTSSSTITSIEYGRRVSSVLDLMVIAHYLEVSMDYLIPQLRELDHV